MIRKTVYVYWQNSCASDVAGVVEALQNMFSVIAVSASGKDPQRQSFDTSRGKYDVGWMLLDLSKTAEEPALWIIDEDICYADREYLYGASWRGYAVVSTVRTGHGENMYKEVCHEVGHMFGLEHCNNACLMNSSYGLNKLEAKPLRLCSDCDFRIQGKL